MEGEGGEKVGALRARVKSTLQNRIPQPLAMEGGGGGGGGKVKIPKSGGNCRLLAPCTNPNILMILYTVQV
jgi:hypothetical protein